MHVFVVRFNVFAIILLNHLTRSTFDQGFVCTTYESISSKEIPFCRSRKSNHPRGNKCHKFRFLPIGCAEQILNCVLSLPPLPPPSLSKLRFSFAGCWGAEPSPLIPPFHSKLRCAVMHVLLWILGCINLISIEWIGGVRGGEGIWSS